MREFSLSNDGQTLRYSVGATRAQVIAAELTEYDAGIRIDETAPVGQRLFRSGNLEGRLATQRYGRIWFMRVPLLADVPDRWKSVDLVTGAIDESPSSENQAATVADANHADGGDSWKHASSSESWVATLTRIGERNGFRDKPDVQLAVLVPGARRLRVCTACTGRQMSGIQWRPGSHEVLATVTDLKEGMAQSVFRWDAEKNLVRPLVQTRGLVNGGRDYSSPCGVSNDAMVCVTAEAGQPPRLERIDLETGVRRILFEPNAALARDMTEAPQVRLLRWVDKDGHEYTGQYYPARHHGGGPPPLFVNYYRCTGFVRGGVGDEWPFAVLAAQGISALCIDAVPYRVKAVERYDLGLSAVASAIDLLVASGEIDRARVGMGGLSFGTEITFWTMAHSDLVTAASVSSVFISPNYYLQGSLKGDTFFSGLREFWQLGSPDETPEQWQRFSLATSLKKLRAPILMQVPEQEYCRRSTTPFR